MSNIPANYEIVWEEISPGSLRCSDYFKATDDQGRSFEGIVVAPTPYEFRRGFWSIFYKPDSLLETSGTTRQKVRVGRVRRCNPR